MSLYILFIMLILTAVVFNLFDRQGKSKVLGMKWVFKLQDLQIFGLKSNQGEKFPHAIHNFKWVKILILIIGVLKGWWVYRYRLSRRALVLAPGIKLTTRHDQSAQLASLQTWPHRSPFYVQSKLCKNDTRVPYATETKFSSAYSKTRPFSVGDI